MRLVQAVNIFELNGEKIAVLISEVFEFRRLNPEAEYLDVYAVWKKED
jgi:hypothetical protein